MTFCPHNLNEIFIHFKKLTASGIADIKGQLENEPDFRTSDTLL
jgi:hypothetical protein